VPAGQLRATTLPEVQKEPAAQTELPVTICTLGFSPCRQPCPLGLGLTDPERQVNPGLQGPEGTTSPVPLQYIPGEHAEHCDIFVNPATLEKAPSGQAIG
jgi:hypothetical protein